MEKILEDNLKEKEIEYYDQNVKEAKKYRASFSATLKSRAKIISRLIKKYDLHGSLLDAGCGTGHILSVVIKENPSRFSLIEGVDFSEEACKNTEQLLGIKTYKSDLKKLVLKDKYDVIICSEVIEHIKEDEKVLKNIYRLLKDKGKLIITVPYLKLNWSRFDDISGHVRRYSADELENKLRKEKFKILESFGWGNFIYSLYFSLVIKKSNPHEKVKTGIKMTIYRFVSNILANIFLIDNLFKNKYKGKTLFVVAEKNEKY